MQPHLFIAHAKCWLVCWLYAPLSKESVFMSPLRKDNTSTLPFRQKPVCAFTCKSTGKEMGRQLRCSWALWGAWRKRALHSTLKSMHCPLRAKPPVFGVHLDNAAADTVTALLAVTRLWGGRAGSQAAQRNAHSPTRAWMRGKPDGWETDKQEEDGRSQSRASPPTCLPHLILQTSGIPMICMWWMAPSTPRSFYRGAGQPAPKYATMAYCFWN